MDVSSLIEVATRRTSSVVQVGRFLIAPPRSLRYIGWVGYENLGDEALFDAVCAYFEPRAVIHHEREHRPAIRKLVERKRFRHAMLGGGTLIGGHYLEAFRTAQSRAQDSIAFGTGVQDEAFWSNYPDRGIPLAEWMPALAACSYVGVRGPDSATTLAGLGVEAEVLGDPACFFAKPASYWTPRENRIGINIGQSRGQQWGNEADVVAKLAQTLRLLQSQGWSPEFFIVWPEDAESTFELVRQSGLEDPPIHHAYTDAGAYLELVREMQVFVGMKLHASVLALCAAVPTLMLEYRPKCLDFMKSIGMEEHNVRTDQLEPSALVERIEHLASAGPSISSQVADRMAAFKSLQADRAVTLSDGADSR